MAGKGARVTITEKQQAILLEFSRSRTESPIFVQRAKIILMAFARIECEEIAAAVGLERHAVGLWRRRWKTAWPELTNFECAEPHKLREAIRETLRDAHRSGCGGTFTAEQVTQILAVACESPELSGLPITQWTHRELRDEVLRREIVDSISVSQIGRYLQQAALQPQRKKMWLNTTEKDPAVFQQQVEKVCETYQQASKLNAENGTRTVCLDEMTGLQALERNAPDKPPQPGQVAKLEFEYTRHGTTTLIGNFDVVSGQMFAITIQPTRTEADHVKHIQQTIAADPHVPWIFMVDNLNTHCSASLVETIAELCEPETELGKKGKVRHSPIGRQSPRVFGGRRASRAVRVFTEA